MKLFVRRQTAEDRQLKLIARADQRRADLQLALMTTTNTSEKFNPRTVSDAERSFAHRLSSPDHHWGTLARLQGE